MTATQGMIVGIIGIVMFLMWITLYLADIHEELQKLKENKESGSRQILHDSTKQ